MMTPAEVARKANVTAQSIRNYSRDYADFLSPGARGEDGPRLYTDEDVEVLCAIAALRKSGVPPAEVVTRLRNGTVPLVVDAEPEAAFSPPGQTLNAVTERAEEPITPPQMAYMMLQSRIEALERRVDGGVDRFVTGIILGMALTLLVVALALHMV